MVELLKEIDFNRNIFIRKIFFFPINSSSRYFDVSEFKKLNETFCSLISKLNYIFTIRKGIIRQHSFYSITLKKFFIEAGHPVENPTYFVIDEINEMRNKSTKNKNTE